MMPDKSNSPRAGDQPAKKAAAKKTTTKKAASKKAAAKTNGGAAPAETSMDSLASSAAPGQFSPEVEALMKVAAQDAPAAPETTASSSETPQQTVASALGEIVWVLSQSPAHRHHFLVDLEWLVMPPLLLRQFRIERDDSGKPAALALWAKVNEEVEQRLQQGVTRMRPQDWNCGDRLVVVLKVNLNQKT